MSKGLRIIVWSLLVIGLFACKGAEELSFPITNYLVGNISFNGFYCNQADLHYYVFYENGVYFSAVSSGNTVDDIIQNFEDPTNYEGINDLPYFFGGFQEETTDHIYMEGWISSDGGGGDPIISMTGYIASSIELEIYDETFLLNEMPLKP